MPEVRQCFRECVFFSLTFGSGRELLLTNRSGNNITGETLLECDHSALKELGITKVGDRVRIFVAVKALRTKAFGNSGKKRNRVFHNHHIIEGYLMS